MERFEKILALSGVDTYFIRTIRRESTELFFVKKKLDLRRMNTAEDTVITVYADCEKDGKKLRGISDVIVDESMSDEEISEKIKSAKYAAGFALNRFFELPLAEKSDLVVSESDLNGLEIKDIADKFVEAIYSEDRDSNSFINSLELFVEEIKVSMKSSFGTDVSYIKRTVKGEFVAQCQNPQDVETYQDFEYDFLALSDIKKLVADTLSMTRDRAFATNMPKKGTYEVLISDKYMPELMVFFKDRANAAYIYQQYSNYEVGKKLQEDVKGDLLNINFGATNPYNEEGIKMIDRPFIEEGVVKCLHGKQRFSDYLGIEKVGTYSKVILPAGKVSVSDMKKNCLHVVNFSDFQMDSLDGHFMGEIRLAYLYDECGNVTAVTGGSVNGSIFECMNDLCFSSEKQRLSNYEGPVAVKLKNVAVNGE